MIFQFVGARPQTEQTQRQGQQVEGKVVPVASFSWAERISVIEVIGEAKGQGTVKITVIGKPGKFVDKGTCVMAVIQSDKVPMLPKGVPEPAAVKTNYVVYVAAKQWK